MKTRIASVLIFLTLVCSCHAGADDPLFALTNGWGKGSTADFRKVVYKNVIPLADKGGDKAVEKWCLDLLDYPDLLDETGTQYWMEEKASTLSFCISMQFMGASTNCWLAAAKLLNRYRMLVREAESNANFKVDLSLMKTDHKRFNEILYSRKPLKTKAWNLKHAESSLARVVTNEFPKSILPLLPESERDKMMSEVLVRSGLKIVKDGDGDSSFSRCCRLTIIGVIACSFVLAGCAAYLRFKR